MKGRSVKTAARTVIVVGAGAVGLCAAVQLQRLGFAVTVIDKGQPGGGASYGNSGMLVADTAIPTAQPGMAWKVPGWLADPLGPLTIRPSYLPLVLPWLWHYWRSGNREQVFRTAKALRALHQTTFEGWRENVGSKAMDRLTRRSGQVYLWQNENGERPKGIEDEVRDALGVASEQLGFEEMQRLFPGLAKNVTHGLLIPGNGYSVNPQALTQALADTLLREGGRVLSETVQELHPSETVWEVTSDLHSHFADIVVIAAGAWSAKLLRGVDVKIPLESERGYHAMLHMPSISLPMPILNKTGYFGLSSMEEGLRVSGTVEFAGLDAPPAFERAQNLVKQARRLFPDLTYDKEKYWMGHRPSVPDCLPVVGPITAHKGLFACFAHGHAGLTGAPASGRLLAQLVAGETPEIDPTPYAFTRFS